MNGTELMMALQEDTMEPLFDVIRVEPQKDHTLHLVFENHEHRLFDMRPYSEKKPYTPLKHVPLFLKARVAYCKDFLHEYMISSKEADRRVDYALCHPANKPAVFIEVKQVGQAEGAERQLFEYAYHRGVPMAILPDGQEWHFYLPGEQGRYTERRFYKLDLLEREAEEIVAKLKRYLFYNSIISGEAIEAARKDYKNIAKNRQILAAIPSAWMKLIQEQDELLVELLTDKVESLCGYKPSPDIIENFLSTLTQATHGIPKTQNEKKQREYHENNCYGFRGCWYFARF